MLFSRVITLCYHSEVSRNDSKKIEVCLVKEAGTKFCAIFYGINHYIVLCDFVKKPMHVIIVLFQVYSQLLLFVTIQSAQRKAECLPVKLEYSRVPCTIVTSSRVPFLFLFLVC